MVVRPPGDAGGRLRPHGELRALLAAARTHGPKEYPRGIAATLTWILGEATSPPLSDRPVGPTIDAIFMEEELARKLLYDEGDPGDRPSTDYLVGVEATAMWCRSRSDDCPLPLLEVTGG